MRITAAGKDIIVQQRGKGTVVERWGMRRYKHNVMLSIGGKVVTFAFYGSADDRANKVNVLPEEDLKWALSSFIDDAIGGLLTFEDFKAEYGIDDASGGRKAYIGCKKALSKIQDLGIDEDLMYDISNEIRD